MCIYINFSHEELLNHALCVGRLPREILQRYLFLQLPTDEGGEFRLSPYRASCQSDIPYDFLCSRTRIQHDVTGGRFAGRTLKFDCPSCNTWAKEWRGKTMEEVEELEKANPSAIDEEIPDLERAIAASRAFAGKPKMIAGLKRKSEFSGGVQPRRQAQLGMPPTETQAVLKLRPTMSSSQGVQDGSKKLSPRYVHPPKRLKVDNVEPRDAPMTTQQNQTPGRQDLAAMQSPRSRPDGYSSIATTRSNAADDESAPIPAPRTTSERKLALARLPAPLANLLRHQPDEEWPEITRHWRLQTTIASKAEKPQLSRAKILQTTPTRVFPSTAGADQSSMTTDGQRSDRGSRDSIVRATRNSLNLDAFCFPKLKRLLPTEDPASRDQSPSPSPGLAIIEHDKEVVRAIKDGSFRRASSSFFNRSRDKSTKAAGSTTSQQTRASAPPSTSTTSAQQSASVSAFTRSATAPAVSTLNGTPPSPCPNVRSSLPQALIAAPSSTSGTRTSTTTPPRSPNSSHSSSRISPCSTPSPNSPRSQEHANSTVPAPSPIPPTVAASTNTKVSSATSRRTRSPQEHETITRLRRALFTQLDENAHLTTQLAQARADGLKGLGWLRE